MILENYRHYKSIINHSLNTMTIPEAPTMTIPEAPTTTEEVTITTTEEVTITTTTGKDFNDF